MLSRLFRSRRSLLVAAVAAIGVLGVTAAIAPSTVGALAAPAHHARAITVRAPAIHPLPGDSLLVVCQFQNYGSPCATVTRCGLSNMPTNMRPPGSYEWTATGQSADAFSGLNATGSLVKILASNANSSSPNRQSFRSIVIIC
jgi:hypothetical protein